MSIVRFDSLGSTQVTAVKGAREVVEKLAELLAEYDEALVQALEGDREIVDPLDCYDELLDIYTHTIAHSILLEHLVKWLDFGWTPKLSTERRRDIQIPEF